MNTRWASMTLVLGKLRRSLQEDYLSVKVGSALLRDMLVN